MPGQRLLKKSWLGSLIQLTIYRNFLRELQRLRYVGLPHVPCCRAQNFQFFSKIVPPNNFPTFERYKMNCVKKPNITPGATARLIS